MKNCIVLFLAMVCLSCNEQQTEAETTGTEKTEKKDVVPETRSTVNKEPVAEHVEKTENPLNEWYFAVRLYETPKTFHYLIRLQYEEVRGEDTLKLPNFGAMPRPVIRKGDEKYSCIIGFLDNKDVFREYKKVYVKGSSVKITALKHYAVRGG
jgi:hypothetical protein